MTSQGSVLEISSICYDMLTKHPPAHPPTLSLFGTRLGFFLQFLLPLVQGGRIA